MPESLFLIKKETLARVFYYEFCEIPKSVFFIEHARWLLLLFQILYSMKSNAAQNQIFVFKFDLNVKMVYRKNSLQKKKIFFCRLCKN